MGLCDDHSCAFGLSTDSYIQISLQAIPQDSLQPAVQGQLSFSHQHQVSVSRLGLDSCN